jgi:hypothetical protein
MKHIFETSLKVFRFLLLIISVILIVISFFVLLIVILDSFKMSFSFNRQGLEIFITMFAPYTTILAATIITVPAYIAIESLISNINNQEGSALLDVRKLLNEPENLEIHKNLRGISGAWANGIPEDEKKDKDTWRKIDNYLGILELINILLDKGVISQANFNNQFGYRVDNVFYNFSISEYLNNYGDKKNIIWKELFSLFKKRNLN